MNHCATREVQQSQFYYTRGGAWRSGVRAGCSWVALPLFQVVWARLGGASAGAGGWPIPVVPKAGLQGGTCLWPVHVDWASPGGGQVQRGSLPR